MLDKVIPKCHCNSETLSIHTSHIEINSKFKKYGREVCVIYFFL